MAMACRLPLVAMAQQETTPQTSGQQAGAQRPAAASRAVHVLGLENVKRAAKGDLSVQAEGLHFESGAGKADIPVASIQDLFTADESTRLVGGVLGTVSQFGPYGSGRFLSLFRKKVDALTVEYRDHDGGLHGVIFQLERGQAALIKKQLADLGAHASVPVATQPQERRDRLKPNPEGKK